MQFGNLSLDRFHTLEFFSVAISGLRGVCVCMYVCTEYMRQRIKVERSKSMYAVDVYNMLVHQRGSIVVHSIFLRVGFRYVLDYVRDSFY